jgi:predicted ATP-grasp superfamily ATP-dependent carboligase
MPQRIRKIAIVGASVRAAAQSALRAGYEVVAADLFADADLQKACPADRIAKYPEGLIDWLAASPCDAWMYTGAIENHPDLVDEMAAIKPLLGNSGVALRRSRDPLQLQAELGDAGLAFPETSISSRGLPLDGLWLCKTYRGASGAGVWRLDGEAQVARAERSHAYFQRHVEGAPAAATFVVFNECATLLGVTRQLLGPLAGGAGHWRYLGSIGPLPVSEKVAQQLESLGGLLARTFRLRGLVGVDLVVDEDRAWVMEINPRYSASVEIVEQASDNAAIAAHVDAFADVRLALKAKRPWASNTAAEMRYGKVILFARQNVVITESFFRWALARSDVDPERRELADISPVGTDIPAGSPVLTVFAAGRHCEQLLDKRLAEVERRLYAAR